MRYDRAKSWAHPVLRPPHSDDYVGVDFETEVLADRSGDARSVDISARFYLSHPPLCNAIQDGTAAYALLVKSPDTFYRSLYRSNEPSIKETFSEGTLSGRVELLTFVVAVEDMELSDTEHWHKDYNGRTFSLKPGDILAAQPPQHTTIDTAEGASVGAIIAHRPVQRGVPLGQWRCNLDADLITIETAQGDDQAFRALREQVGNGAESTSAALMAGVYLPTLVEAMQRADQDRDGIYKDRRWYRALDDLLSEHNLPQLGQGDTRLEDAQALLRAPLARLLRLSEADEGAD